MTFEQMCEMAARTNREKGLRTKDDKPDFYGLMTCLALITSEVGEAIEVVQKQGLRGRDQKCLSNYKSRIDFAHELADIMIRTMDVADLAGIDLFAAVIQKLHLNANRPHKYGTVEEQGQQPS